MSQAFHSSLLLLRLPQFLRKSLPNQIFFLLPRPIFQIQATNAHPSRPTYILHLDQPIVMLSDASQLAKSRSKLSGIGASTTHPRFRKRNGFQAKIVIVLQTEIAARLHTKNTIVLIFMAETNVTENCSDCWRNARRCSDDAAAAAAASSSSSSSSLPRSLPAFLPFCYGAGNPNLDYQRLLCSSRMNS